jgi:hypothetical protein
MIASVFRMGKDFLYWVALQGLFRRPMRRYASTLKHVFDHRAIRESFEAS